VREPVTTTRSAFDYVIVKVSLLFQTSLSKARGTEVKKKNATPKENLQQNTFLVFTIDKEYIHFIIALAVLSSTKANRGQLNILPE